MPLYDILNEFQKGSSHMAAVVKVKDKDKKNNMELLSNGETPKENMKFYQSSNLTAPSLKHESHDVVVDIDKVPKHVKNRGRNFQQNGTVTRDLPCLLEDNEDAEVIGIITLEDVFEELLQVRSYAFRFSFSDLKNLSFMHIFFYIHFTLRSFPLVIY